MFKGMKNELNRLNKLIDVAEKDLKRAPEGRLRVDLSKKHPQYYIVSDKNKSNGKYSKKDELSLATKIAQRDYAKEVLTSAVKEKKLIEKFEKSKITDAGKIYDHLNKARKILVQPYEISHVDYIKEWSLVKPEGLGFKKDDTEHYSLRGLRVRSKSEETIANILDELGLHFRYEDKVFIKGYGDVYTDFTILDEELLLDVRLEHFGMMDDPHYAEKAIRKINGYHRTGYIDNYNFLTTFETKNTPLDGRMFYQMIKNRFFRR